MAKSAGPTEAEFLAHEAEVAQAAIGELTSQIVQNLKAAADPQAWTERYPLPALGTALAGGVAAAAVVKPMVMGKNGHQPAAYHAAHPQSTGRSKSKQLLTPLFDLLKGSVKSAIIAGITAKAANDSAEDEQADAADHAAQGAH